MMKKQTLLGLILALTPLLGVAATDNQYPAANFEPTVIYLDKDLAAQQVAATNSAKPDCDGKYPAASFEPKVVYADPSAVSPVEDKPDPKYPAAYFKHKVIYP